MNRKKQKPGGRDERWGEFLRAWLILGLVYLAVSALGACAGDETGRPDTLPDTLRLSVNGGPETVYYEPVSGANPLLQDPDITFFYDSTLSPPSSFLFFFQGYDIGTDDYTQNF